MTCSVVVNSYLPLHQRCKMMTSTSFKALFRSLTFRMRWVVSSTIFLLSSTAHHRATNWSHSQNVGPGGTITNTAAPFQGSGYTNYTAPVHEEETEPIRAWREKRDAEITHRDEVSQRKKEETVQTAQKDIDSFYESYNRKVDKQKAQTAEEAEEFLAKREDTTAGGTSWERIAKLVDLSGKGQRGGGDGSSKKRMRELLLSLKADSSAPGASGV